MTLTAPQADILAITFEDGYFHHPEHGELYGKQIILEYSRKAADNK